MDQPASEHQVQTAHHPDGRVGVVCSACDWSTGWVSSANLAAELGREHAARPGTPLPPRRWAGEAGSPCQDCACETLSLEPGVPTEHYAVTDQVWAAAGMREGFLCIGCLERRLGRELTRADFPDCPINDPTIPQTDRFAWSWRSDRLRDRLSR